MNKKGFTLIELLAVIVILAVIALIATPAVLNIINNSKNKTTLRSAELYVGSVENSLGNIMLDEIDIEDGTYSIMKNGNLCLELNNNTCTKGLLKMELNGKAPNGGTITIKDGKIEEVKLEYKDKTVSKNNEGKLVYLDSNVEYIVDAEVEYAFDDNYDAPAAYLPITKNIRDKFQIGMDYDLIIDDGEAIELTGINLPDLGFSLYFKDITDISKEGAELHAVMFGEGKLTFLTTKEINGKHNVKLGNPRPLEERMFFHIDNDGDIAMTSFDFLLGDATILIKDNEGTVYFNEVVKLEENDDDGIIGADRGCRSNLPKFLDVYTALNNGKTITIEVTQTVNGEEVVSKISRNKDSMIYYEDVYLSSKHPMSVFAMTGC